MDAKLNLYDFLAYVIPGAIVLILLYRLYVGFLAFPLAPRITLPDTVWFLVFLTAGYFLGHVVQAAGSKWQKAKQEKDGWLTEKYLQDDNSRYTHEYKSKLKKAIEQAFGLEVDVPVATEGNGEQVQERDQKQRNRQQEIFYLCSALLPQEMKTKADIFRAVAALYRGIYSITSFGSIVSAVVFMKHFFLLMLIYIFLVRLPRGGFLAFDGIYLLLGGILCLSFAFSGQWLQQRWGDYTEYYVDSVYTNFYAWYTKGSKLDAHEEIFSQQSSLAGSTEGKNGSSGKQ